MTKTNDSSVLTQYGDSKEKYISFSLCSLLFIPSLNNFVSCILQIGLSIDFQFLTPIMYIFMAMCNVLFLYGCIFKHKLLFAFSVIILLGCILSYFIYPEIRSSLYGSPIDLVYAPLNKVFYFCIPAMIGIANISRYDLLFKSIKSWARVTVAVGIFTYMFVCLIKGESLQYMVYSYHMLISICACFMDCEYKRKGDFILALFGSACILACGARGAVVSLLLFLCVLCFSTINRKMSRRSILLIVVQVVLLLICVFFFERIVAFVISFFEQNGIESRFLNSLVNGSLFEGSGRENISDAIIRSIKNNPFGYGFFGDRYATLHFGIGKVYYAHNLILELLCDFGIVVGLLILLGFTFRLLKIMYYNRGSYINKTIVVLLPYGVFQLMFSSSYLECAPFFMIVGILFFSKQIKRIKYRR